MLIDQIIKFELRVQGLLAIHVLLQLVIFKTDKNFQEISSSRLFYYLQLRYCSTSLVLPYQGQITFKI